MYVGSCLPTFRERLSVPILKGQVVLNHVALTEVTSNSGAKLVPRKPKVACIQVCDSVRKQSHVTYFKKQEEGTAQT